MHLACQPNIPFLIVPLHTYYHITKYVSAYCGLSAHRPWECFIGARGQSALESDGEGHKLWIQAGGPAPRRASERASHKGKAPPPPLLLAATACEAARLRSRLARDILVIRASISPWERQCPLYSGGAPLQCGTVVLVRG